MNPVAKALWFIESHFTDDLTLDDVANAGGVSRYHMSRVFGSATGRSIVRYVRGRRLSEAPALSLAAHRIFWQSPSMRDTTRTRHSPAHFAISSA